MLHYPRNLLFATEPNAHWCRYVLAFARPLQPFQVVAGKRQLAVDGGFVAQDLDPEHDQGQPKKFLKGFML